MTSCRVLQETELGRILMKYVDGNVEQMLSAYLTDYIHMKYKSFCSDDAEKQLEYEVLAYVYILRFIYELF